MITHLKNNYHVVYKYFFIRKLNLYCILEAYNTENEGKVVLPSGIYNDDQHVDFAMIDSGRIDEDDSAISDNNFCL